MAALLKPSSSAQLVVPVASWISQLSSALEKLDCKWPVDIESAAKDKFAAIGVTTFAQLVISLYCSQGSLRIALSSDTLTEALVEIIGKHVRPEYPANCEQPVAITESLLLQCLAFSELSSTTLPNKVAAMKRSFEAANQIFEALKAPNNPRHSPVLEDVLRFVHHKQTLSPYTSGAIVMKEENTFLYEGTFGAIQIGIPPETIKTSMKQIYVLPASIMREAINFGDVEFPIFFNYFCKKAFFNPDQKVIIIGDAKTIERVKTVFRESIFGPTKENIYIDEEISPHRRAQGYRVNFAKEVSYLAVKDKNGHTPPLEEFAHFKCFDEKGSISFPQKAGDKEVKVAVQIKGTVLQIFEDDVLRGTFDTSGQKSAPATYKELPDEIPPSVALFEPPVLGVTFIGTSHGFDPKGRTTGFIIWINGEGILVDPPIQTPEFLLQSGIHRRTVKRVILTHVHSDHDSGLIRKILEGERIEVYTTRTVCEAYVRKVNAILGSTNFSDYFTFRPVPIDFEFDYSFHVLPTVRFKLSYMGKKIAYSADTFYSPSVYASLLKQGVFNLQREVALRMFLFDADMIMHECGVPPIHTDIFELNNLPVSVKQNMHIVHCSGIPNTVERVLEDGTKVTARITGLSIPKTGVDHTVALPVGAFNDGFSKATRVMQLLSRVYYFRAVPPSSLVALMSAARELHFRAGDLIVHRGDPATHFYILESGKAEVWAEPLGDKDQDQSMGVNAEGLVLVATLGCGHYFGEGALTINSPTATRNANVLAKSECTVIALANAELRTLFRKDSPFSTQLSIEEDMLKLQKFRPFLRGAAITLAFNLRGAEMLAKAKIFKDLKSEQMEVIAASLEDERTLSKGTVLFRQGDPGSSMYFIREGAITLLRSVSDAPDVPPTPFKHLGAGDSFGEMALISHQPRSATAVANENTVILELRKNSFDRIMHEHQNLRYVVQEQYQERVQETVTIDTNIRSRSPSLSRRGSGSTSKLDV